MRTTFETLNSSCVVIEDRLDPEKQRGIFDPKIRARGEFEGDLRKVPCVHEAEEHIAAEQIFPLIKTGTWYTPTIKHHCCRTALASSLRACSNRVSYDPKLFSRYAHWFRSVYIPMFLKCVDEQTWEVDFERWLKRYPKGYQNKMRRVLDNNHLGDKLNLDYEAFTKVEMQFTEVSHNDKETELNETKERQICGPTDQKKIMANAFVNTLEEIASKHFKPYCGRHNWIQICESLEEIERNLKTSVWGESDGSGFDMTQFPACNELMNELMMKVACHPNMHFNEPLTIDWVKEAIEGSLILNVSVDHGDLKYQAQGRASGDGWTTFGNTMLMISYWMFTFYIAGIKDFGLKVKGDDVLFCVQEEDLLQFKKYQVIVFTDRKDEHTHGLGQICKKIKYGSLVELTFLSNEFFLTQDGHYRMARIPARVIQTNSWSTKVPKFGDRLKARQELCYSKGMCLKAWADGLPIFGVLADKMIQLGKKGKLSSFDEYADADRVWHRGRDDYAAYALHLQNRYEISLKEIKHCEREILKIKDLFGFIDLPELERLYVCA